MKIPQHGLNMILPVLLKRNMLYWSKPIFLLLERFAGIEELFDHEDDVPANAILRVLKRDDVITDDELADAISRLDCFTYRAKNPKNEVWNPLDCNYWQFEADANGHVRVFQWDTEYPEPAVIKKWLLDCCK